MSGTTAELVASAFMFGLIVGSVVIGLVLQRRAEVALRDATLAVVWSESPARVAVVIFGGLGCAGCVLGGVHAAFGPWLREHPLFAMMASVLTVILVIAAVFYVARPYRRAGSLTLTEGELLLQDEGFEAKINLTQPFELTEGWTFQMRAKMQVVEVTQGVTRLRFSYGLPLQRKPYGPNVGHESFMLGAATRAIHDRIRGLQTAQPKPPTDQKAV